ncbi:MAG TPA: SIMPL domain-containing protein, partial [Alphaproteobacteria bacterium]|nr:SIMPL domain-containing protein [Alphaproteobacteria bacterium]
MSEMTLRKLTAEEERVILARFGLVSMNDSFIIENPFGISVFGSALLRVSPDTVTINAAITRLEPKPAKSFAEARQGAQAVTKFLKGVQIKEFGLSRLSVSQEYRVVNQERKMVGYRAKIGLTVIFNQLELIEEVVSGLVEAGVDEVSFIEFSTSQLKELRTRA